MDVTAYVQSLGIGHDGGRRSWRRFQVTQDQVDLGGELFRDYCASCHGPDGKSGYAPELNNPEFLAAASDGFLVATIARGRESTPMRPFGPGHSGLAPLSHQELVALVGFIRSGIRRPGAGSGAPPRTKTHPSSKRRRTDGRSESKHQPQGLPRALRRDRGGVHAHHPVPRRVRGGEEVSGGARAGVCPRSCRRSARTAASAAAR